MKNTLKVGALARTMVMLSAHSNDLTCDVVSGCHFSWQPYLPKGYDVRTRTACPQVENLSLYASECGASGEVFDGNLHARRLRTSCSTPLSAAPWGWLLMMVTFSLVKTSSASWTNPNEPVFIFRRLLYLQPESSSSGSLVSSASERDAEIPVSWLVLWQSHQLGSPDLLAQSLKQLVGASESTRTWRSR